MAKKSVVQRNIKRLSLVKKFETKRAELKKITMSKDKNIEERLFAQMKLDSLPRDSATIRVRNRCLITGRGRGCYRRFKMSRTVLRNLGSAALIPGLRKASL